MTLVPAYGRDYKSAAAVKKDWDEQKDFIVRDISSGYDGSSINKQDAEQQKLTGIQIRYDKLRKVVVL